MQALQIIQIIFGVPILFFFPGYLCARIFFGHLLEIEKISLAFILSLLLDICVGLLLGYNMKMKEITGGITPLNLWLYLGSITLILILIWWMKNDAERDELLYRLRLKRRIMIRERNQ